MRSLLLICLFSLLIFSVNAQPPCTGPGRTATAAVAVCGTLGFQQKNLSVCQGQNIPNPTAGCGNIVTSDNAAWYKFHCYQTGTLGFLLNPYGAGDDFDWELMDITGHDPNDVFSMELRVSLNLSGVTGPTGCSSLGTGNVHCAGGPPGSQYNAMPTIITGHDYLLMVNNYSATGLGYDINFSGTAVLNNNTPPTVTSVAVVGCDASKLKVTFSEDIICDSISPVIGSEFSVTAGAHPISALVSDCLIGANGIPYVIINLQTALTAGNYQLNIGIGSDGNTLQNACTTSMLPVSIPFTVAAITPAKVNSITFSGCAPNVLNVTFDKPIFCNSITFSGSNSEFVLVSGAGNIPITSVQGVCSGNNPYATLVHINLTNPLPFGNYQLQIKDGPDGDTFIDTCYNKVIATSILFPVIQTTTAPVIPSIGFDECHPNKVVVNFDKPVLCSTIATTGSDFTISPGVFPVTNAAYTCVAGGYTTQVVLTLQTPLPAGNFAVNIIANPAGDNNTVSDTCYAFTPNGYSKSFTATKAPAPKYDSLQVDKCNPSQIKVFYSNQVNCATVFATGIEFYVTGPAPVNIVSVSGNPGQCTNWLLLTLSQPITTFGNYVLHNKPGPDGNSVVDTCGAAQDINETIGFTVLGAPNAAFTSQVKFGCKMDTVTFTHPGGNGVSSWVWNFPDGTTATGQTVIHLFPVSTATASIQLTVDNGSCTDVITQTITLGNAFDAVFTLTPKDTTCINVPVNFTNSSIGTNLQYIWLFGDNTQFNGPTPPAHSYTGSNSYTIQLVAADTHGCFDTAAVVLYVGTAPVVDFTGLAAQYCTGQTISLASTINTASNYTWDNGDGVTVQNKPLVQFTYTKEGVYNITLTATDKYCGATVASKPVQIFAVPQVNLGRDTILCPAVSIPIGVPAMPGYTYLWSTGAVTAQILTDILTADYSLAIDNNGCTASDAISVKVLSACLIKVPNAFTPNNDGLNDVLRATNADLAKEFLLKVYNRYGELVFSTTNPVEGWNGFYKGVKADPGTYIWQLGYIDPWSFKKVFESGTSILLR